MLPATHPPLSAACFEAPPDSLMGLSLRRLTAALHQLLHQLLPLRLALPHRRLLRLPLLHCWLLLQVLPQ